MATNTNKLVPFIILLVIFGLLFFAVRYFLHTGAIVPSQEYLKNAETTAKEKQAKMVPQPPYVFWQVEGEACVSCAAQKKDLDEIKPKLTSDISFETKNIVEDPDLGEYFDIKTLPTLMVFDSKNQLVFRYDGNLDQSQLLLLFKELGVVKP